MSFITLILAMIIELTMTSFITLNEIPYSPDLREDQVLDALQDIDNNKIYDALEYKRLKALETSIEMNGRIWDLRFNEDEQTLELYKTENGIQKKVYTSRVGGYGPSLTLETDSKNDLVIVTDFSAGGEGSFSEEHIFQNGIEKWWVGVPSDWGGTQYVNIGNAGEEPFRIEIMTDEACSGPYTYKQAPPQTKILGLRAISKTEEKTFPITTPFFVDCIDVDGLNYAPSFKDVETFPLSIMGSLDLILPNNNKASVILYNDSSISIRY